VDPVEAQLMRIVLAMGPSVGGIGRHVRQLADALADDGDDVTVAAPASLAAPGGWFSAFTGPRRGFTAVPLPGKWSDAPAAVRRMHDIVAGADVVHGHGLRAGLVTAVAARRAGVPSVVTVHNLVSPETAGRTWRVTRAVEPLVGRLATVAVGASPDITRRLGHGAVTVPVAATLAQASRPRQTVRAELGVADRDVLALCVARLHPQKRLEDLIDAAADPAVIAADVVVRVAGDGPSRDDLAARIARTGSPARLLGRREDVADLLGAADVAVLSSAWEAIPLSLQEAALAGLPLVGTDSGGTPLIVEDGVTGVLVPVGDVTALAGALCRLAQDSAERATFGDAARVRVREHFGGRRMLDSLGGVYRDAIRSSTQRPRPGGAG
jgi:glycosyltransferase involved in cell wall biosynthesis